MGLGWDEPITHEISTEAKKWFQEVDDLKVIKAPRSLPKVEKSSAIHTFGAMSYIICQFDHGYYGALIIASKAKVTPLKSISRSRLE